MLNKLLMFVVLFASLALGQNSPAVSQHFKPGDTLHYYVQFDGNPDLGKVFVQFRLLTPLKDNQVGFQTAFDVIDSGNKVSPGVFEVNGTIPKNVASGTYQLKFVYASHDPQQKSYTYPEDFKDNLTIEIVNEPGFNFPKIKAVSPAPPK